MGRTAKIALVAVLGALILTLAIVSVVSPSASGASAPPISGAGAPPSVAAVPAYCRSATDPDEACTDAWEAKRRRFFGKQDESR